MKLTDYLFPKKALGTRTGRIALLIGALFASSLAAPELLAFPYRTTISDSVIYAEQPIDPALRPIFKRSDRLIHASPIYSDAYGHRIFLTSGGWRWKMLTFGGGAFGYSSPLTETIVINRSSVAQNRVYNGSAIGSIRSLSSVIAHEQTHGLLRNRYGFWVDRTQPAWKLEGYCDYVARESSLSDADVAALHASGKSHPALVYYEGRRRVAVLLTANGGNVDALFK